MAIGKRLNIGQDIVLHKFIQALPSTIAPVIASQKNLMFACLGQLADELMSLSHNNTCVYDKLLHHCKIRHKTKLAGCIPNEL